MQIMADKFRGRLKHSRIANYETVHKFCIINNIPYLLKHNLYVVDKNDDDRFSNFCERLTHLHN